MTNEVKYYVEIRKFVTDEVVKRMGPYGERKADQIERGANINLNHETHYTELVPDDSGGSETGTPVGS